MLKYKIMKRIPTDIIIIVLAVAALICSVLCSCQKEEPLFTNASVNVVAQDSMKVLQLQATMQAKNINTGRTVTTSAFEGCSVSAQLQRGAYRILIEGKIIYATDRKNKITKSFRAYTDYCELVGRESNVSLDVIILD